LRRSPDAKLGQRAGIGAEPVVTGRPCIPADPVDSQDGQENVSPNTRLSAGGDKPAGDGAEESPGAFGIRAGRVRHVDDGVYVI